MPLFVRECWHKDWVLEIGCETQNIGYVRRIRKLDKFNCIDSRCLASIRSQSWLVLEPVACLVPRNASDPASLDKLDDQQPPLSIRPRLSPENGVLANIPALVSFFSHSKIAKMTWPKTQISNDHCFSWCSYGLWSDFGRCQHIAVRCFEIGGSYFLPRVKRVGFEVAFGVVLIGSVTLINAQ